MRYRQNGGEIKEAKEYAIQLSVEKKNESKLFLLKLMPPRCHCHTIKISRSFWFVEREKKSAPQKKKTGRKKKGRITNNKIGIIKVNTRFHIINSRSICFNRFFCGLMGG